MTTPGEPGVVRPAQPGDVSGLALLDRQVNPSPWTGGSSPAPVADNGEPERPWLWQVRGNLQASWCTPGCWTRSAFTILRYIPPGRAGGLGACCWRQRWQRPGMRVRCAAILKYAPPITLPAGSMNSWGSGLMVCAKLLPHGGRSRRRAVDDAAAGRAGVLM